MFSACLKGVLGSLLIRRLPASCLPRRCRCHRRASRASAIRSLRRFLSKAAWTGVFPLRFDQMPASNSDGLLANRAFMRAVDAARAQAAQQKAEAGDAFCSCRCGT